MKCPHCKKEVKAPVKETRQHEDGVYRSRLCINCQSLFVTLELTKPGLAMPAVVRSKKLRTAYTRQLAVQHETNQPKQISLDLFKVWSPHKEPT